VGRLSDRATCRAQDTLPRFDNLRFPPLLLVVGLTGSECDRMRMEL